MYFPRRRWYACSWEQSLPFTKSVDRPYPGHLACVLGMPARPGAHHDALILGVRYLQMLNLALHNVVIPDVGSG